MQDSTQKWIQISEYDLTTAQAMLQSGRYLYVAFMCQQAVEKSLKALFLLEKKGIVPQSHSLIYLASNTTTPKKFYSFLKELTPKFIDTRYPDASVDLPSRIYDKNNTEKIVKGSKEVMKWAETKLK